MDGPRGRRTHRPRRLRPGHHHPPVRRPGPIPEFRRRVDLHAPHPLAPARPGGLPQDAPYFISVTSETDTATKIAFPIATTIGTALGSFQKFATEGVSSSLFFRRTTPFNQFMLNGQVDRVPDVAWRLPGEIYEADPKERIQPVVDKKSPDYFQQMLQTVQFNAAVKDDKGPGAYRIYATDGTVSQITILDPKEHPDVKNRSGFWVFRVEKNIMNGHSDIWNLNAIILYTKLFRLSCPRRVDGTQVEFPGYDPYVIEAKLQPDL